MEFDSLKSVNNAVKNSYPTKKTYSEDKVNVDNSMEISTSSAERAKVAENTTQEQGKYSNDELYKGENFQQKMDKAIEEANKMLEPANKSFSYSIHKETNEVMIKIKDNNTGEIIKEIPSEESLDMVAKMRELAGIVIDEKR